MSVVTAERQSRAIGAVLGCIIADAAAAPLHWIYDFGKVKELVKDRQEPEFLEKSHCPFYTIPVGSNTCYGDQAWVLLKSLVDCKGFDKEDYKRKLYENFGPESAYEVKLSHPGPPIKSDYPVSGAWRNSSIKEFLKNYAEGKEKTGKLNDAQADGFCKMAPLAAMYAGDPNLPVLAEEVIRVTQDDDLAVKLGIAAAHLLEHAILNGADGNILNNVKHKFDEETTRWLHSLDASKLQDHATTIQSIGTSCSLPGSFISVMHCLLQNDGSYVTTVRKTLSASGDNASRSCLVGAAMGAQLGKDALPSEWIEKTTHGHEALQLAEKLVSIRK